MTEVEDIARLFYVLSSVRATVVRPQVSLMLRTSPGAEISARCDRRPKGS